MTLASSREADLVFGTEADRGPPDVSGFLGPWHNTNAGTSRIRKLTVEALDAGLSVRIWGVAGGGLFDWGPQPAEAFACIEENGVQATSLYANYDFGFMTTALQWRLNKGILPLMSFNVFRDDSGRSNYYTRELFCRSDISGDAA
jgi:hypothetical protein